MILHPAGARRCAHLERVDVVPAPADAEDLLAVEPATLRVERVFLEHRRVHVRRKHERVHVPVVAGVVTARDVVERSFARAEIFALHERDLLTHRVPELGVIRSILVRVYLEVEVGKEQLAEVEQPNVDISAYRLSAELNNF